MFTVSSEKWIKLNLIITNLSSETVCWWEGYRTPRMGSGQERTVQLNGLKITAHLSRMFLYQQNPTQNQLLTSLKTWDFGTITCKSGLEELKNQAPCPGWTKNNRHKEPMFFVSFLVWVFPEATPGRDLSGSVYLGDAGSVAKKVGKRHRERRQPIQPASLVDKWGGILSGNCKRIPQSYSTQATGRWGMN